MAKSALICCHGKRPTQRLLRKLWAEVDLHVAADGGAATLLKRGWLPDVIIGDLDSFDATAYTFPQSCQLLKITDQSTNDADKAINYCLQQNVKEIHLIGADGGRLDQFVANLELLTKYRQKAEIYLWSARERFKLIQKPWQEDLPLGTRVSLFPWHGEVRNIHLEGVAYTLTQQHWQAEGWPSGVSNTVTHNPFKIALSHGLILMISTWR